MILYTTHINNYDANGYKNVTLTSGDKYFAPTSALLWAFKYGKITRAEFMESFIELIEGRIREDPTKIIDLCSKEVTTIACYCDNGVFCHRLLLVNIICKFCSDNGIEFEYLGEI